MGYRIRSINFNHLLLHASLYVYKPNGRSETRQILIARRTWAILIGDWSNSGNCLNWEPSCVPVRYLVRATCNWEWTRCFRASKLFGVCMYVPGVRLFYKCHATRERRLEFSVLKQSPCVWRVCVTGNLNIDSKNFFPPLLVNCTYKHFTVNLYPFADTDPRNIYSMLQDVVMQCRRIKACQNLHTFVHSFL